ncbi:MAG: hypothetical protein E7583_11840 [Ruminococcaceae bacterium]|nr:hypothetical protein [Oscillospiraceae bacterium]
MTSEDELLSSLEINETWIGEGCERCHYTGYSGRIAVHEVLIKDEKISQMIYEDASAYEIERYAVETGMITMRESASKLLKGGIISEGEYLKTSYGSFGMIGKVK